MCLWDHTNGGVLSQMNHKWPSKRLIIDEILKESILEDSKGKLFKSDWAPEKAKKQG